MVGNQWGENRAFFPTWHRKNGPKMGSSPHFATTTLRSHCTRIASALRTHRQADRKSAPHRATHSVAHSARYSPLSYHNVATGQAESVRFRREFGVTTTPRTHRGTRRPRLRRPL